MIDIHSHILPEIDDGPNSLSGSVEYVKMAYEEGITVMFATPHAMDGVYQCTPKQILFQCFLLGQELKKKKIPVTIMPGSEIRLSYDVVSQYEKKNLVLLNNSDNYILLELPPVFILEGVLHIIDLFVDRGITTIIAHPERNTTIIKNPDVLSRLIYGGALMQITAMSLMGNFGKRIRKISETMVKNNTVTFIASDIHPGRKFMMQDAYKKTSKLKDEKTAERIFLKNPKKIMYLTSPIGSHAN